MNYKNTKMEDEIIDADERNIRALLGDLKRVEAPADFDFHLKARIAHAEPNHNRAPRFLPQVLRYALPLGLVILVAAFVIFNGVYFADEQNVSEIAETKPENPPSKNDSDRFAAPVKDENVSSQPNQIAAASASGSIKKESKNKRTTEKDFSVAIAPGNKQKPKTADKNSGGSRTLALTPETRIITPPGINPNRTTNASPNAGNGKSLTVKEVLSQLGVEANFERENWRVKSVVKNSLAERSGVRAGDAVEAIDGERLSDNPLKNKTVEGKALTVARGTEKLEISLTNKSN